MSPRPGDRSRIGMDVDLPAEDDPRRVEVRRWFAEHPQPSPRDLVDAGYVVPHWPKPYGLDADPALQLIIEDEMRRASVSKPMNPIGIGHCGPILVALGERRAEGPVPPADAHRRGAVVPAVQRTGRRLGPRQPEHARRARRRRVRRERPEDLDVARRASRSSASSSPARAPTCRSTAASRTSSSRWTSTASRSVRSAT